MEAPTQEWRQKVAHDSAHTDDKTRRTTTKARTVWDTYLKRKDIDPDEYRAAQKLYKIYWGSRGVDVRQDDNYNPDPLEYPQTYYAQKLEEARKAVKSPMLWCAMLEQVELEEFQLATDIGRKYRRFKDRAQAHAAGITMIQSALEILAVYWGMKKN